MGLRIARLLSQVVILEGDLVVWVKEAAVTQVSMLRYQDLQGKQTAKPSLNIVVYSSSPLYYLRKTLEIKSTGSSLPDPRIHQFWQE